MRNLRMAAIALVVLILLGFIASYMVTYTVRFTETAVKTTWGEASDEASEGGLHFMIPGVNSVTKYDRRNRFVESKVETQPTNDQRQVATKAFATWRIENPKTFYERFSSSGTRAQDHYDEAESVIQQLLRNSMSEIGQFRFDELLGLPSDEPSQRTLEDLERVMLARMNSADLAGFTVTSVGISSMKLPQQVTEAVFDRMKQERARIASKTLTEGQSEAAKIKETAKSQEQTILAFADSLASGIRAQGEQEAAQYLAEMRENQNLAVFMKEMAFLKQSYGTNTMLVLPLSTEGFKRMSPDALRDLQPGEIPTTEVAGFGDDEDDASGSIRRTSGGSDE